MPLFTSRIRGLFALLTVIFGALCVNAVASCTLSTTDPSVTICEPANGSTVNSPVHIVAGTTSSKPVTGMWVYVDNVAKFHSTSGSVDTTVAMANGTHAILVKAWNSAGVVFKSSVSVTVSSGSACTLNTANPSVTICEPANGASVSSPVHLVAGTTSSAPVTGMWAYVDNVAQVHSSSGSMDTSLTIASGTHTILVKAWNNTGAVFHSSVQVTVAGGGSGGNDATLSKTSMGFGSVIVGRYSAAQSALLKNNTASTLNISSIHLSSGADYTQLNNCGVGVPANGSCEIMVFFRPQVGGTLNDSVVVDYSGAGSPATLSVGGTGLAQSKPAIPINHILVMMQENRGFDHYFGKLNSYRASLGLPQDVDGLPANASNKSKDGGVVTSFHMASSCMENVTPSWNDSHRDVNLHDPSVDIGLNDGFVDNAAGFAQDNNFFDQRGVRAMGYYDASDLPYYYFMASQFATGDRWFSPVPTSTPPNREYFFAATSHGTVQPPTTTFNIPIIFQLLQNAGVSWKIYYTDKDSKGQPESRIFNFQPFANDHLSHIVPMSQYFTDLQNGTLPAVALLESGYSSGRDEHPGGTINGQPTTGTSLQHGAAYAASLMNALMKSSSWKSSVFIWTFDEGGGTYDHVTPPLNAVSPDGIKPQDMPSGGVPGDFTRYGFRLPLIVASPFTKKHYVSHTPMDYTAIDKLIEERFGLGHLTARDAAQPDMLEFFDFSGAPWLTPPTPPTQPTSKSCNYTSIPE
jgi:phospholipase C